MLFYYRRRKRIPENIHIWEARNNAFKLIYYLFSSSPSCSSYEDLCIMYPCISSSLVPSPGPKPELPHTIWKAVSGLVGKWVLVPGAGGLYLAGRYKQPTLPTSNRSSQHWIHAWPGCFGAKYQKAAWMLWLFSVMGMSITLASSDECTSTVPWFKSEGC